MARLEAEGATELWDKLRNQVNNRIKQEEVRYKRNKISDFQGNPSRVWGLAKKFMEWSSNTAGG